MTNKFYTGLIISVNDPLKVGRVQIKVDGIHDEIFNTEALPWAMVMLPSTSPAHEGVGTSPTWLIPMSQVVVIFLDDDYQQPLVLGVVSGAEDIHPLAVEKYPFNKVINTPSGHLIEIDDSPSDSRLFVKHKSGSYLLIDNQGDVEVWSKGTVRLVSDKDTEMLVQGDLRVDVQNNASISVKNRASISVGDSADIKVTNDVSLMCPSITMTEVSTQFERAISENLALYQREGVYGIYDDAIVSERLVDLEDTNQLRLFAPVSNQNVIGIITQSNLTNTTEKMNQAFKLEKEAASQLDLIEKSLAEQVTDANVARNFVDVRKDVEKLIAQTKIGIDDARESVQAARDALDQRVQQIQQRISSIQERITNSIETNVLFQQLQSLKSIVQNITESVGLPIVNILNDLGLSQISQQLYKKLADINYGLANISDVGSLTDVYTTAISRRFTLLDLANDGFGNAVRLIDNVEAGADRGERILNNLGLLAEYLEKVQDKYPGMKLESAFRNIGDQSDHSTGLAADISWDNLSNEQMALVAKDMAESLPTKEVSLQYGSKTWIHVSLHGTKDDYSPSAMLYTRINDQALDGLVVLDND